MLDNRSFKICLIAVGFLVVLVYWKTWQSWGSVVSECCQEPVKQCWACKRGVTIGEFCAENPGIFDCPPVRRLEICCKEEQKDCLACKAGISVVEFCKAHSGEYGCEKQSTLCCQEQSKECLSCKNHQTVWDFCQDNAGYFGCPKKCCLEERKECLACQNDLSVEAFCKINQGLNGCPSKEHGEIMLGISLLNKKGYTQFTASVLRKYHNITEVDIHIFDDASSQYTEDDVRQWYGKNILFFSSDQSLGFGSQVRRIFDYFIKSDYKVLFLVDGETIFLKEWRSFIKNHIYNETDGFLSLYHSATNHIYNANCENMTGDLCEGQVHGELSFAITHPLAEKISKQHPGPFNEINWTSTLAGEGVRLLYPEKSLVMRIGQKNQGGDNCGENEVAYRFNRCALPKWIKNGIEFYFDRCTSSDEVYFPEHSMEDVEKDGRFWTRPVISYSFYGSRPRYTQIAVENAVRVFSIYPGWKIWIYTDGSPPQATMDKLCEFDVRIISTANSTIKSKMSWRFLVASEPVKMYAVRDIDSYLLKRGKAAVDEWIKSGRKFHVLRDHPNHSRYPMSGGMWGGTHDAIPNMKEILLSRQMNDQYMQDMNFLNGVIWKIASKSVWAHDSHSLHKFGEDHPFPTQLKDKRGFVGNVILYPEPKSMEELGPRFP